MTQPDRESKLTPEMREKLQLTPEERARITPEIREEISQILGKLAEGIRGLSTILEEEQGEKKTAPRQQNGRQ